MRRETFIWQLPEAIEARLGESTYGRQRTIFEDGHLLIILHTPPSADTHDRSARVFLRKPNGAYQCNGVDDGEHKLRRLLETFGDLLQKYEDAYERARSVADLRVILDHLTPLTRSANNMSTALQSARDLVREDSFLIGVRDEAYEISRGFELLQNDARLALDYRIAESAEQQSVKASELTRAQHKLNVLAALTFPLMAVATVFGMNIASGLEAQSPVLFWFVFAVAMGVGMFATSWITEP